uniref:Uncharacterized protein n=1 Tax=Neolamprologus brichardi TaxID=32507 RepID=A0A3Q4HP63_NEOBR
AAPKLWNNLPIDVQLKFLLHRSLSCSCGSSTSSYQASLFCPHVCKFEQHNPKGDVILQLRRECRSSTNWKVDAFNPWLLQSACQMSLNVNVTSTQVQRKALNKSPLLYFPSSCCAELPGGTWSEWTSWSECSKTCFNHVDDVGVRRRFRSCTPFNHTQSACDGDSEEQEPCNTEHCPVPGGWSAWSAWSQCSSRCDSGVQTRERLCDSPTPQHGGQSCSGPHIQTRDCNAHPCSVDGQWSAWTPWGHCSVSCGAGLQSRYRFCSSPRPSGRGLPCTGPHHEDQVCIIAPCDRELNLKFNLSGLESVTRKVMPPCRTVGCSKRHVFNVMRWLFPGDGGWGQWSHWTECTKSCGGGVRSRRRNCDSPSPEGEGNYCEGLGSKVTSCNTEHCPGAFVLLACAVC